MELQHCRHEQLLGGSCRSCGSYCQPDTHVHGLKTKRWSSPLACDSTQVLKSILRRASRFQPLEQPPNNTNLNEFVADIVSKFKFSLETHALGLYIFYGVVVRRTSHSYNQLLYASVSLLVAAKSVEREQQIPKLSALKKAACNYLPKEDYSQAERAILQLLEYNIDICTFVTLLQYYLCNGIIFSCEEKTAFDVARLENAMLAKATDFVRNGRFLSYKPEKFAAWVVHGCREQLGLPGWNAQLQAISQLSVETLKALMKELQALQKPQVIPLQFHSINIIKVKELIPHAKKLGCVREVSREPMMRDCRRNLLTVITNDSSLREFKSVAVLRR